MSSRNFPSLFFLFAFLASCQSVPDRNRRLIHEQCGAIYAYESVEIDRDGSPSAELIIDMRKSTCRCRRYKLALDFIGPIANTSQDHPIEYCDRLIGEKPDEYLKKVNFLGDLRADLARAK